MGGNSSIMGSRGVQIGQKINISKMSSVEFDNLKKDILEFLSVLNSEYQKENSTPLWPDFTEVAEGNTFSGSTEHFFKRTYDEFVKIKPTMGDIDVQVPVNSSNLLPEFLNSHLDEKFGKFSVYGLKSLKICGVQINTLVDLGTQLVQMDFEFVEYEGTQPTLFSKMAHCSDWEDMQSGIKGLFIKELLRSAVRTSELVDFIIVSSKTKRPLKSATKKSGRFKYTYGDLGYRQKFRQVFNEDGTPLIIDNKECWEQIPTSESDYITDFPSLYKVIFKEDPREENDKYIMFSFIRTLKRMAEVMTEDRITTIYKDFVDILWGSYAKVLSVLDKQEDVVWKTTAHDKFVEICPFLSKYKDETDKVKNAFYEIYDDLAAARRKSNEG